MSHEARMEVWEHSRSEGGDKLVLLALAEHADKDTREAWPSIDRLSSWTGLGRRSVQRSLRKLERLREVVPVALGGGRQQSARYRIVPREGAMQPTLDGFGSVRDDALYVADDALSTDENSDICAPETATLGGLNGDAHAAQTENSKKEPEPPSPLLAQGEEQGDLLDRIKAALAERLPEYVHYQWIAPLSLVSHADDRLSLDAPHHLRGWIRERYLPKLAEVATELEGRPVEVVVAESDEERSERIRTEHKEQRRDARAERALRRTQPGGTAA